MKALILAGGRGTRLASLTEATPKPLLDVAGKPFVLWLLERLSRQGVESAVLSVGYLSERIISRIGDRVGSMRIEYCVEESPLGTGGAIKEAVGAFPGGQWLVLNGDSFCEFDLDRMRRDWDPSRFEMGMVLQSRRALSDSSRYGSVDLDSASRRVTGFREKASAPMAEFINAGIYFLASPRALTDVPEKSFSFENRVLPMMCAEGRIQGLPVDGYFIDIGIPEDYARAGTEIPRIFGHDVNG